MVNLKFVSSNGIEFDLHDFDSAKLFKANFHKVTWEPETIKKQYGTIINRFTKPAKSFDCTFRFKGDPEVRKAQIDAFIFETEHDISVMKPGRIWWNNQYIEVYFDSHSCAPVDSGMTWTELSGVFYASWPFWIEEAYYYINPGDPDESGLPEDVKGFPSDRDFTYGYTYSYPYGVNAGEFYVDSPTGADFKAVVHGPITYFKILIGGNNYQVNYPLRIGQKLVIDSRDTLPLDEKCYVINENDSITNVFDYRDPTSSIYKRLPGGDVVIYCDQPYVIDLTLYLERSAPR